MVKSRDGDLTGQRFGDLTVLCRAEDYVSPSGYRQSRYICRCECGKEKTTYSAALKQGRSISCGCKHKRSYRISPELDKSNPINIDMIDQEVMDNLITEIVRQAVADWTSLCKCKRADKDCWACKGIERKESRPTCVHRETKDCNFTELTAFFESGCAGYISQGAAERIYKKLRKERVKRER